MSRLRVTTTMATSNKRSARNITYYSRRVECDEPLHLLFCIAMTEPVEKPPLPDRLSADPHSPHHVAAVFERGIGIRFNDMERSDVEEYCVSEGWVKVPAGKARDRKGLPLLIKLKGKVEAYYR
jgi:Protein of unknown function (DUF3297)